MRLAGAILLALALPGSTVADSGLTGLVNSAYLPRTESTALHDIAHQRAVEISSDFSHNGQRSGTAEVIAYNSGFADPVGHVLGQWQGSPPHDAILSDPSLTLIGCGSYFDGVTTWFACLLATGSTQPPATPPAPPDGTEPAPTPAPLLPNTATRTP